MKQIKWTATKDEVLIMSRLATRAKTMADRLGIDYPIQDVMMDIEATHCNGCPLALERWLASDDGNFGHDVFGIRTHLDRSTGELKDCFLPRFAARQLQS